MRKELAQPDGNPLTNREWFEALDQIWITIRLEVVGKIKAWKKRFGKITPSMLGAVCIQYDLPFKSLCEKLESEQILPSGMYEHLSDLGLTAGQALKLGQQWIEETASLEEL